MPIVKFVAIRSIAGDQKVKLENALLTKTPPLTVARMVHSWGRLRNMPEHVLAKQLTRYRDTVLAAAPAKEDPDEGQVVIIPKEERVDALKDLQWLAGRQRERVEALLKREKETGKVSITTTTEINQYASLLKDTLKAEFDCGEREFKGPVGGKGASVTVTPLPNGSVNVEVVNAVERATALMQRIPILIEGHSVRS